MMADWVDSLPPELKGQLAARGRADRYIEPTPQLNRRIREITQQRAAGAAGGPRETPAETPSGAAAQAPVTFEATR
jgi:hypothetical protein